jgi:hypothetical protein
MITSRHSCLKEGGGHVTSRVRHLGRARARSDTFESRPTSNACSYSFAGTF